MEKYLGVKVVEAEQMSYFDYLTLSEKSKGIVGQQFDNQDGYEVVYPDGYVSWSPKEVFEKAYRRIDGAGWTNVCVNQTNGEWEFKNNLPEYRQYFSFGKAIEALRQGKLVCRSGWNGKGMWLKYIDYQPCNQAGHNDYGDEILIYDELPSEIELLPWIGMKTADQKFVPWSASQTDMLAEDWQIVE